MTETTAGIPGGMYRKLEDSRGYFLGTGKGARGRGWRRYSEEWSGRETGGEEVEVEVEAEAERQRL